jgi:hypothetical protein
MANENIYNGFAYRLLKGDINFTSGTFHLILMKPTYVPNKDTQDAYDDISSEELPTAAGYTAGGKTVAGQAFSQDNVNDLGVLDIDDATWTSGPTFTARYAVLLLWTGTPSTSYLVCWYDFGADKTGSGGSSSFIAAVNPTGALAARTVSA